MLTIHIKANGSILKRRAKNTGRNSPWSQLYIAAKIYGRNSIDATLLGRNSTWAEFYLAAILPSRKNLAAIVYGRNSTWPQFYGCNSTAAILRPQLNMAGILM